LIPADQVMLQEFLPGGGEAQFSFGAICVDGRPLGSLVARRTRQYPVDFGHSSSYVETVEEPRVEQEARRLLAAMRYTGLVEVEFKHDPREDSYKVLDVNPRLWTWYTIGRRAGVDFPYLAWRVAQGERVSEVRAPPGLRWVRMGTDLLAAAGEIWRGRLSPRAYIQSLRGPLELALFSVDDPVPALAAAPILVFRLSRRAPVLLRPVTDGREGQRGHGRRRR
jgi:predicted ATP-grasp superfamily ATP-dependent carboligase